MKPAIRIENLSKQYRIGAQGPSGYRTLRESLAGAALAPWRRLWASRGHEPDNAGIHWALKDVSFKVQPGEVVGIIGRNGAGKSTLLKILSRITEPTRGRAVIRGRVASLLEVGTGFHPELTGRENIYMNGTVLGMRKKEIDRKFDEIVDFSGVETFLDTPIKRYSSGMQVRLAFAVAAHLEPEILIIDEVLAVGDAEFQRKCLGKMQDVAKGGRTVVFVSHNMAAVEALCRRGIEVKNGCAVKDGDIADVLSHYRHNAYNDIVTTNRDHFHSSSYFESAYLIDSNGQPTNFITLGATFYLRIVVTPPRSISRAQIALGIDSITGERLLTMAMPRNRWADFSANGSSALTLQIADFPLAPGEYSIKLAIHESGRLLETVEPVVPFTVTDAEIFGTGEGFRRGRCIARGEWSSDHIDVTLQTSH
jgi:lipopolysaccharide transport system ATP-binding protein